MRTDVAIIGAGPAGSHLAGLLAGDGLGVVVLERHAACGDGVICSGIIGAEAFRRMTLPQASILHHLQAVRFVSPAGKVLRYDPAAPLAHVVDRRAFDGGLAEFAKAKGARYWFEANAEAVAIDDAGATITVARGGRGERLTAQIVVLATGFGSPLIHRLGLGGYPGLIQGVQVEVSVRGIEEVEIYLGALVAPGSFAWAVPLGDGRARIGLTTRHRARHYLDRLLESAWLNDRVLAASPIQCAVIPVGALERTSGRRLLVVGEAAGQVKTTTQGGIYYGLLGAEVAAPVLRAALAQGQFEASVLQAYDRQWRARLASELRIGMLLRGIYRRLRDPEIDGLVELADRDDVMSLVKQTADFDWHRGLVMSVLRHPLLRVIFGSAW